MICCSSVLFLKSVMNRPTLMWTLRAIAAKRLFNTFIKNTRGGRTALTATVITYRRKSAIRDVGKALGLPGNFIEELNRSMAWWDKIEMLTEQMQKRQLDLSSNLNRYFFSLVKQILGTPAAFVSACGWFFNYREPDQHASAHRERGNAR